MISAHSTLLALSKMENGRWDAIFNDIQSKKQIPEDYDVSQNHRCVTLVDPDYPTKLKQCFKPPFALFYEGNLALLNESNIMCVCGCDKGDDNVAKMISDLCSTHIIISGDDSSCERMALQTVMKNQQPLILVLNEAIDESDLDDEVFLYAVQNGLVITEFGWVSPDIDETQLTKARIIGFLADSMLVTSSNRKNTRLCLLIDEALSKGIDLFVLPEKPFCGSLNNDLIKDGALLVNKKEDIF